MKDDLGQAKNCTKCKTWKGLDQFHHHATGKHGRLAVCKECKNSARRIPKKTCPRCEETKYLTAFAKNPQCKDGRTTVCKDCKNERVRELRAREKAIPSIHKLLSNWQRVSI